MKNKTNLLIIGLFSLWTILFRTSLHIAPNIEFVTALSALSGYLLYKDSKAYLIPLIVMGVTDLIIGNSIIFIFTWTGFLLPVLLSKKLFNKRLFSNNKTLDKLFGSILIGLSSTVFFFLWTNFGVVITTEMYSKDLFGLFSSYFNALPFLKMQLVGNLFFVPAFIFAGDFIVNNLPTLKAKLSTLKQK